MSASEAMTGVARIYVVLGLVGLAACRVRFDPAAAPDAAANPAAPDAVACALGGWSSPPGGQPFANVNTGGIEWAPGISDDGLQLVFASDRTGNQHRFGSQRTSPTAQFDVPVALAINDGATFDRDPSFNDRELYFVSGRGGGCIYVSSRIDAPAMWSPPRELDALCNGNDVGGVHISGDGRHLYYDLVIDTASTLVMASRSDPAIDFATAGVPVDGLLSEMKYCTLTADELTIYCETSLQGGRTELWQATRTTPDAAFSGAQPVPGLDAPSGHDGDPSLNGAGTRLVYAADSGTGDQDLRVVERNCE